MAFVVDPRAFKVMAFDLDLGVVEKYFHFTPMQPAPGLGLLAGPIDQGSVHPVQRQDALFGLGAQPFSLLFFT